MSKIYISGPISGHRIEERIKTFQQAEEMLIAAGYEVKNPFKNGLPQSASTNEHMRADLKMLLECDEIFMLDKWNHSAGRFVEFAVAVSAGCRVTFSENISKEPTRIEVPKGGFITVIKSIFR